MNGFITIGLGLVALAVGILVGLILHKKMTAARFRLAEEKTREAVAEAEKRADALKREAEIQAKDHLFQAKAEFEAEAKERRQEILNMEKRLLQKEENLEKRIDIFDQKEGESVQDGKRPSSSRRKRSPKWKRNTRV